MDFFVGKAAVITGCASGIGRALAEELCRRGVLVTLADLNEELLRETMAALVG